MKAGRIFLFEFSILFTILSATIFNIERQLIATQNGTLSKDLFTNPGGCSRSSICTNLKGVCHNPTGGVVGHCCVCECRNEQNLFYSLRNGCTTSKDAIKRTQIAGRSCAFYLESHGINSVPTFSSAKQLNNSNSEVKHDSKNFGVSSDELDSADIWCHPRRIYYITKFAKERLIFENSCLEIMTMVPVRNQTTGSIQRFLKFSPNNDSDWGILSGKLLKAEIVCKNLTDNSTTKLTSCFVFRVNGTYNDEVPVVSHHSPKLCPPAPPYIPPPTTILPPIVSVVNCSNSSLVAPFNGTNCTSSKHTPNNTLISHHRTKAPISGKVIGAIVGSLLGSILVIIMVTLLGCFLMRRYQRRETLQITQRTEEGAETPFLGEATDGDATAAATGEPNGNSENKMEESLDGAANTETNEASNEESENLLEELKAEGKEENPKEDTVKKADMEQKAESPGKTPSENLDDNTDQVVQFDGNTRETSSLVESA